MNFLNAIPDKHSGKWGWIFGAYFLTILFVLILCQLLLHNTLTFTLIVGLTAISVLCTVVLCFGGFIGGKKFFAVASAGTIIGLLFAFFISLFNVSDGWSDIIGLVVLSVFFSFSSAAGIITEWVYNIHTKRKILKAH